MSGNARDENLEEEIANYLHDEIAMLPRSSKIMAKEIMEILDCHCVLD